MSFIKQTPSTEEFPPKPDWGWKFDSPESEAAHEELKRYMGKTLLQQELQVPWCKPKLVFRLVTGREFKFKWGHCDPKKWWLPYLMLEEESDDINLVSHLYRCIDEKEEAVPKIRRTILFIGWQHN